MSGVSKASANFTAAHGEFHASGKNTSSGGSGVCVGMAIDDSPRGFKNPHGLSLDKSKGYLSQTSTTASGTAGRMDVMQLSDRPSLDDLLQVTAAERLHHMPQKGSDWDRSIRTLEGVP